MENKQIIIDGCDVSGCKLYRDDNGVIAPDGTAERTELCFLTNDYCGNNTNCYYKQLARKEQECDELKREKRNFYNFLTNKYNYGSFRPMWGTYLLRRFFKEDLGDFFDEKAYKMADTIEEKEKQLDRYSQTLTEIKEIAEENIRIADLEGLNGIYRRGLAEQILQKISEVEND